jgi:multisubunit Na+/H+ antiporter MnhB subunit
VRVDPDTVLGLVARAAQPVLLVLAVWLLAAGHNLPGGGFVGGLVAAVALALARVADTPTPLRRWLRAEVALPAGLVLVVLVALLPLTQGRALLDLTQVELALPVFGVVKTGTALVFDVGVLAIVVGLVQAVLDAFLDGETADLADVSVEDAS